MIVTISMKVQSSNKHTWAHWTKYKKYKDTWFLILSVLVKRKKVAPDKLVRVRITSYRERLLDYGNLVGGCKPIPDYLVAAKWLKDDSPKWCSIEYEQAIDKNYQRTTIEIYDNG